MTDIAPPSRFPWPPVLLLSALLAGYGFDRVYPLHHALMLPVWIATLGGAVIAIGLAIDIFAARHLLRSDTELLPHRPACKLIDDGPFRFSRNPIYLGNGLIILGAAVLFANAWLAIALRVYWLLVTQLAIKPEERHLAALFGEEWQSYKRRTPRWFGPF